MYRKDYTKLIEKNWEEIINKVEQQIAIKTVSEPETVDGVFYPFGKGVSEAFDLFKTWADAENFESHNFENKAMHIKMGPKTEEYIALVAHLDVVPATPSRWITDPYVPWHDEEFIYGRGSQDDKGPAVALFYAMKFIQELNIPLNREVRLIFGGNEEKGHMGVDHYFTKNHQPYLGFTADLNFPLTNQEKGGLIGITTVDLDDSIISINGGVVVNAVASDVTVEFKLDEPSSIKEDFSQFLSDNNIKGEIKIDKVSTLSIEGTTSHGSIPFEGVNAVTYAANFLNKYIQSDVLNFIDKMFHNKHFGEAFNIEIDTDDIEYKTTTSLGMVKTVEGKIELHHDMRYTSVLKDQKDPKETIENAILSELPNATVKFEKESEPFFMAEDSTLVTELLSAYSKITGVKNPKPGISGGGTYAKDIDNIVAFGLAFPNSGFTMHSPNERMPLRDLSEGIKIYIEAIINLANS